MEQEGVAANQRKTASRKKKPAKPRLAAKNARVRVKKQRLFHALVNHHQMEIMKDQCSLYPTNAWIYGNVKSGNKKNGWLIDFEFVGEVLMRSQKAFTVVNRDTEEPRLSAKALRALEQEQLYYKNAMQQKDGVEVESEAPKR